LPPLDTNVAKLKKALEEALNYEPYLLAEIGTRDGCTLLIRPFRAGVFKPEVGAEASFSVNDL
jgi:hypothetical protein